jgi:pimeloyl-ACP methyl ester carboxylesterase
VFPFVGLVSGSRASARPLPTCSVWLLVMSAAAGCGGAAAEFGPCPSGPVKSTAECAVTNLPVRADRPNGATLPILVRRYPAAGPSRGQLWILPGGPGGSGSGYDFVPPLLAQLGLSFDLYVPDHRGTGKSSFLGCWANPDQLACVQHLQQQLGDDLAGFNTTEAARDLAAMITRWRKPGEPVFIIGTSYGSYWAHRYLQLFPDQPTGVVFDGVCVSSECKLSSYDRGFDEVARNVFEACRVDPFCGSKLGADPYGRAVALLDKLDKGSCKQLKLTRSQIQGALGYVAQISASSLPAWIYRLDRCGPSDVTALQHFIDALDALPPFEGFSVILQDHIALSEMWADPPPTVADLNAAAAMAPVTEMYSSRVAALYDQWPRYAHDSYVDGWATSSVPMLFLDGSFDFQTPLSIAMGAAAHFSGPSQSFVTVPYAGHVTSLRQNKPYSNCVGGILARFLDNPTAPVDASCTSSLVEPGFEGQPASNSSWFGVADAFDG